MGVFSKWLISLDYEYRILSTCVRRLSNRATCDKCASVCDKEAITIKNDRVIIEQELCNECGKCMAACPVQAIEGIYPKRTVIDGKLVMEGKYPPNVKELLILARKGVRTIMYDSPALLDQWQSAVRKANQILLTLDEEPFTIEVGMIAEEITISRRDLFFFWKKQSKSVLKEISPAHWRFNHDSLALAKYFQDVQFAKLSIDLHKCTLCQICVKLCPKHCFKIEDEYFLLEAIGCENCGLCVDVCPEQAIVAEDGVAKAKNFRYPIYETNCQACQRPLQGLLEESNLCPVCRKRQQHAGKKLPVVRRYFPNQY